MQYIALAGLLIFFFAVSKGLGSEKTAATATKPKTETGGGVVTLLDIINDHAKRYNVPVPLIKAIIKNESSWNPNARNPNDPSYGLMGIMPIVAQDYGIVEDWHNVTSAEIAAIYLPYNNIGCGSKLLGGLLKRHDMATAVEMYNVGERGYEELGRRNSNYRNNVMSDYIIYANEE